MSESMVYIVDDDPSVLKSMRWLLESENLSVATYPSGSAFLDAYDDGCAGCLILDMRMPEMSGLDVQRQLAAKNAELPVIVMTGHGDVPMCTKSFTLGAFDFIEKPADDEALLQRIKEALAVDRQRLKRRTDRREFAMCAEKLTSREAEVLRLLASGKTPKQIAMEFDISIQTVAKHRAKVLEKLNVNNDVELAHLVARCTS
jgi:two-component system, LuxR family, response regulator FixJ